MRLRLGFTTYNRLGNTRNHVWETRRSPRIIYQSLRRINHINNIFDRTFTRPCQFTTRPCQLCTFPSH
ncbi:hypothetical protein Hanom_Chr09g00777581 [Helianthus anomalus]